MDAADEFVFLLLGDALGREEGPHAVQLVFGGRGEADLNLAFGHDPDVVGVQVPDGLGNGREKRFDHRFS
jgi:hypothetical protein